MNDVLDFTRMESGKVTISPEPVDITQLTDNVQAIMNGLLYNRDLKFEVHREIPKNPYVLADVARIREVLVNLLGNAVKFTNDGGKITLDISSYPGADEKHIITRYVVRDNGIGMSEEFQKNYSIRFHKKMMPMPEPNIREPVLVWPSQKICGYDGRFDRC